VRKRTLNNQSCPVSLSPRLPGQFIVEMGAELGFAATMTAGTLTPEALPTEIESRDFSGFFCRAHLG
jgi:hypothetical protein